MLSRDPRSDVMDLRALGQGEGLVEREGFAERGPVHRRASEVKIVYSEKSSPD
ncbi:hypothetical protein [Lentzea waywayandensis]|uniref:hypothetical protein n=1 Tax=Lentzea waywayandensis TaxID=84724 RepID=UPI0015A53854|nr:hypothetical protein [Lentzea waywayandensis]